MELVEFKNFLGLIVYTSVFKFSTGNIETLFSTDETVREISEELWLKNNLRSFSCIYDFNNLEDQQTRREHDRTTAISELFLKFAKKFQSVYTPVANVCVHERLVYAGLKCTCLWNLWSMN